MESALLPCRLGGCLARFPWAAFRTIGLLQAELAGAYQSTRKGDRALPLLEEAGGCPKEEELLK
jgi:hypothetical protein